MSAPLVSILIPAYNAEKWIAETIQSAIAQTWQRKEIIVVDDGSRDRTAEVARRFASKGVTVVSTENRGAAAARNHALQLSQGDYIQWLDNDDLLAADKIERQLAALGQVDAKRILLSSQWAPFYYRTRRARFVHNSLCQDLSPVEWLLRKMGKNLHMQTSTWLTSRELAEAAGPWDLRLLSDDDGEYFCRVLMASEGTRFVPGTGVFWRVTGSNRLSYIGNSDEKKELLLVSMKLHIEYLRSLEESERVRRACLSYLQTWYGVFYPERPDLVSEAQALAAQLQGRLEVPRLRWKYVWMRPALGWKAAKWAQNTLPQWKASCIRRWDKTMYALETGKSMRIERRLDTKTHTIQNLRLGNSGSHPLGPRARTTRIAKTPLVSTLIPAHNAEKWIEETMRSAMSQTWENKEVIVVDDGSTDQTLAIARRFESESVRIVSQKRQGAAAARNHAFSLSHGDYIQWLDADDLLAPDKVERQLATLREGDSGRILLSSPWGAFYYRTQRASFAHSTLWQDLSPVDWLLAKMGENLYMQPATWLTSRELAEAAGPWDTRLSCDDDGEYFCRVLAACEGTRFVPDAKVFYRFAGSNRVSYIGASDEKKEAMLLSMKLHVHYLRSLEESERVRRACLTYLQTWFGIFYPERPDLVAEMEALAAQLHGRLEVPRLRWKYAWMRPMFGWRVAKWSQRTFPQLKASCIGGWDKGMYRLEAARPA